MRIWGTGRTGNDREMLKKLSDLGYEVRGGWVHPKEDFPVPVASYSDREVNPVNYGFPNIEEHHKRLREGLGLQ